MGRGAYPSLRHPYDSGDLNDPSIRKIKEREKS